jgi:protein-tyrosine phosphatase
VAKREVVHPFQNLSNFRDIGGLQTVDGRTVKTGVLFRSEELSRLSVADLARLREYNIKLICDLRTPQESLKKRMPVAKDNSIQIVNIPIYDDGTEFGSRRKIIGFLFGKTGGDRSREFSRAHYHHIAFERTSRIRDVITLLSKEENLPALFHCAAGKDRTGFIAATIQLLVGVPYETVMEDYLCTNDFFGARLEKFVQAVRLMTMFQVSAERIRLIVMTQPDFLQEVHDAIISNYGSVERYFTEACEIDPSILQNLKKQLLSEDV